MSINTLEAKKITYFKMNAKSALASTSERPNGQKVSTELGDTDSNREAVRIKASLEWAHQMGGEAKLVTTDNSFQELRELRSWLHEKLVFCSTYLAEGTTVSKLLLFL